MKMIDWFDQTPFVNEECGDTMWNEENLNPPKSKSLTPEPEEVIKEQNLEDSSTDGDK